MKCIRFYGILRNGRFFSWIYVPIVILISKKMDEW